MAAQARPILNLPLLAVLAVAYGRCVGMVAPGSPSALSASQATVAGQKVAGIACRAAANGEMFEATALGTAVAEAGAAFAVGARLMCDAQGRVIAATTAQVAAGAVAVTSTAANGAILSGADLPQYSFAMALQAAGAAGEFVEVMILG